MSTYWSVYCPAHEKSALHGNHEDKYMHLVIRHRHAIAAFRDAHKELGIDTKCWNSEDRGFDYVFDFMNEHKDCELVVRSEYGEIDGRCSEDFRCSVCDSSHYCVLPLGHEGEHSSKERT